MQGTLVCRNAKVASSPLESNVNKQILIDAIQKSGGSQSALDEVDDMWVRVNYLQKTGRYGALLSQISNASDKSNLLALTLELNFAYQFESAGLELTYEVSQDALQNRSEERRVGKECRS